MKIDEMVVEPCRSPGFGSEPLVRRGDPREFLQVNQAVGEADAQTALSERAVTPVGAGTALNRHRAVFTIVQNEPVFLPIWLGYYTQHFCPDDVYVLDHDSSDGVLGDQCWKYGVHVFGVHRGVSFDHLWMVQTVQAFQRFLLQSYENVLFTEVDEIVTPRGNAFKGLSDYIEQFSQPYVRCCGYEVIHLRRQEPPLDFQSLPLLAQRRWYFPWDWYSKPLLAKVPLDWSIGFHGASNIPPEAIDPQLVLLHLHCIDYDYCLARHRERAARRWNQLDIDMNWGYHSRFVEQEAFDNWFPNGLRPVEAEVLPEQLKVV